MVELRKKTAAQFTPINPSALLSGLVGVTILNSNQPYPDQTTTPTNLSISASYS